MKIVLKRVVAYIIDIILVSLISTFLTSNSFINKDYDKYANTYDEYEEVYNEYTNSIEELDDELTDDEYNKKLEEINKEYEGTLENYNYKLVKLSIIPTSISIIIIILYFVVLQYLLKGQTIGKKIMKLQVKSNNDKKLTIFNYILRSLIVNEVLINILSIIFLLVLKKEGYLIYNQIIYVVSYIIEMVIIFMIAFDKNHRSLHDYIANTKVIDLKEKEVVVNEM
ncbi:MAG: RDD family protein [Bacilli bacterium]|nr:RDD family protein [Bacilli bacterium]